MDELIRALEQIADAIYGDTFSIVWSIIFTVIPILLTVTTIVLSVRMDRQNQKLQKMIADRDAINQTRQCILDIYITHTWMLFT